MQKMKTDISRQTTWRKPYLGSSNVREGRTCDQVHSKASTTRGVNKPDNLNYQSTTVSRGILAPLSTVRPESKKPLWEAEEKVPHTLSTKCIDIHKTLSSVSSKGNLKATRVIEIPNRYTNTNQANISPYCITNKDIGCNSMKRGYPSSDVKESISVYKEDNSTIRTNSNNIVVHNSNDKSSMQSGIDKMTEKNLYVDNGALNTVKERPQTTSSILMLPNTKTTLSDDINCVRSSDSLISNKCSRFSKTSHMLSTEKTYSKYEMAEELEDIFNFEC